MTDSMHLTSEIVGKVPSKKFAPISRSRKPLQVLQASATDDKVLVSSPKMVLKKKSDSVSSKKNSFTIAEDKKVDRKSSAITEIVTGLRRSSRRNGTSLPLNSEKEDEPPSSKQAKGRGRKKVTKLQTVAEDTSSKLNQSSLDAFFPPTSKSSEVSDDKVDTKDVDDTQITVNDHTMRCTRSVSEGVDMLISDHPSLEYYKKLAEQRRIALQQALYENMQLHDQLEVLQTENMKLKDIVEECTVLANIVNGALA